MFEAAPDAPEPLAARPLRSFEDVGLVRSSIQLMFQPSAGQRTD